MIPDEYYCFEMNSFPQERDWTIDYSRAMAIVFVVIGHFLEMSPFFNTNVAQSIDFFLYTIHVPAFLICSGFLFKKTIKKYDTKTIIITKFFDCFVVWMLWTTVLLFYNSVVDLLFGYYNGLSNQFFYAANELWYFPFLFCSCVFTLFVYRFGVSFSITIPIMFLLAFFFSYVSVDIDKFLVHFLLFIIGFVYDSIPKWIRRVSIPLYGIGVFLAIFVFHLRIDNLFDDRHFVFFVFMLKITGGLFLLAVFECLRYTHLRLLELIGSTTLYIYIFHFFILAWYRRIGVDSIWGLPLFILTAIILSIILREVFRRSRFDYLIRPSLIIRNRLK